MFRRRPPPSKLSDEAEAAEAKQKHGPTAHAARDAILI
jgi:hypothetical protein